MEGINSLGNLESDWNCCRFVTFEVKNPFMSLEEKINKLREPHRKQVEELVDSLLEKTPEKDRPVLTSWFGGLKHLKGKYTAIELQRKAFEWRIKNVSGRH